MRVLKSLPFDWLVGVQRRWPVGQLAIALATAILTGIVLVAASVRWDVTSGLAVTAAFLVLLVVANEALRDRGQAERERIWRVCAAEWKLATDTKLQRTVKRHHRDQRVEGAKPIPARTRVNGTPRVTVTYTHPDRRWGLFGRDLTGSDVQVIVGNYWGSDWDEHDPKAVARLRTRLESRLGITLRTVHTDIYKQRDLIEFHQAAPLPDHVDIGELPRIPGHEVIGFVGPDDAGRPNVFTVERDDGQAQYVLAVKPPKLPHSRAHGRTGRGKSVTLDDLIRAFLDYALDYDYDGDGVGGHVVAADCKGVGTFVKWKNKPGVTVTRSEADAEDAMADVQALMVERARSLDRAADEIVDAYDAGAEPPPAPAFEPVLLVLDELMSLQRWLADQDAQQRAAGNGALATRAATFRANLADVAQKGRATDVHILLSSQWANVEGAGGAKFDSETRGQMELVIHMGPTTPDQGKIVFGSREGSEWGPRIPADPPGRAGVLVADEFYIVQMPYTYDPVAHGPRSTRVHEATRWDAFLEGRQATRSPQTPPDTAEPVSGPQQPADGAAGASPTASPTATLRRLDIGG